MSGERLGTTQQQLDSRINHEREGASTEQTQMPREVERLKEELSTKPTSELLKMLQNSQASAEANRPVRETIISVLVEREGAGFAAKVVETLKQNQSQTPAEQRTGLFSFLRSQQNSDEAVEEAACPSDYFRELPKNSRGGFTQQILDETGSSQQVYEALNGGNYEDLVTRAQAVTIANRLLGMGDALKGEPPLFDDVPLGHWAAASIYRCREEGIISGFSATIFKPNDTLEVSHAEIIIGRILNSGDRTQFDRESALEETSSSGSSESAEQEQNKVLNNAFTSMAQAEGGRPTLVHYDSGRVNLGKGSWTGGHIPRLMDLYVKVATDNNMTGVLYGYFGGKAKFDEIKARFVKNGIKTKLSKAEETAFRTTGGDPVLAEAQDLKGMEDISRYMNEIGTYKTPYPYLDESGSISELAAVVIAHVAHQAGSSTKVINHVRNQFGGEPAKIRANTSELDFIKAVGERVSNMVQAKYKRGVQNRYNKLVADFGGSSRRYHIGELPRDVSLQGQVVGSDGAVLQEAKVEIVGPDGKTVEVQTNKQGFFAIGKDGERLKEGEYKVQTAGAEAVTVSAGPGNPGWAQLRLRQDLNS